MFVSYGAAEQTFREPTHRSVPPAYYTVVRGLSRRVADATYAIGRPSLAGAAADEREERAFPRGRPARRRRRRRRRRQSAIWRHSAHGAGRRRDKVSAEKYDATYVFTRVTGCVCVKVSVCG